MRTISAIQRQCKPNAVSHLPIMALLCKYKETFRNMQTRSMPRSPKQNLRSPLPLVFTAFGRARPGRTARHCPPLPASARPPRNRHVERSGSTNAASAEAACGLCRARRRKTNEGQSKICVNNFIQILRRSSDLLRMTVGVLALSPSRRKSIRSAQNDNQPLLP